ncbi:MAG: PEP-CTERM sorting domain-containing protein, partial [Pseudonocardiaceae bacterium]
GQFCIPSSGTPTTFLDAPPWTFSAPTAGATLTVVDAFLAGERFEIFDFGVSLAQTSVPGATGDCGDDPVTCLGDPDISSGIFALLAGLHSLTIVPTAGDAGSGYLRVAAAQVPEPATLTLLAGGLIGLGWGARTRRSREYQR